MDTIVLNRVLKCDEALRKIDRSDWHELKAKMLSPDGEKILTGLQIYFLIEGRYTDVIKW